MVFKLIFGTKGNETILKAVKKYAFDSIIEKISSKDLSELIGYTASQIRQDINCFGGFGRHGTAGLSG